MIASHYAAPVERHLASGTTLRLSPDDSAEAVAKLEPEDVFLMLDDSLGWAWGYGGRGEIGDGAGTDRHTPVRVAGLSGVQSFAAG